MTPRSIRSSTPSPSASRHRDGSSRSSPRSRAKWLRVPAEMTSNGMSCSAAIPATSAWVPSPPATPSRSAPSAMAWRASAPTSMISGPSSRATVAPRASALSLSPNRVTFPPPERGFMIRYGRLGGGASCSRIRSGAGSRPSAARPTATATASSPIATSTTHSSPLLVYRTSTTSGRRDRHRDRQPADQALVGQRPPHPSRGQAHPDQPDQHQGHARAEADRRQGHQHGRRRGHQGQAGQPALGEGRPPRRLLLSGHHPLITAHFRCLPSLPVSVDGATGRRGITPSG